MNVITCDPLVDNATIKVEFFDGQFIEMEIFTRPLEEVLKQSDFISIHVPSQKNYVIGEKEIESMKDGAGIINVARGGLIDEVALIDALESNKLSFAALDTFENEPSPSIKVLKNDKLSLTPHIGAATKEAQDRIGTELAEQIKRILKTV